MDAFSEPSCDVRIWTFAKGAVELTVEQWTEGDVIVVTLRRSDAAANETAHAYDFSDQDDAAQFHARLESSLVESGWSFVGSLPERRSLEDRRHHLRNCDRRRWWTDGALNVDW
jgi:hypothetical protein